MGFRWGLNKLMMKLKLFILFIFFSVIVQGQMKVHGVISSSRINKPLLGFGTYTRGAYSGSNNPTILTVTELSGSSGDEGTGRGSFLWALSRTYPRIIKFEVSGNISLPDKTDINNPYLTILGQTAPSPGITVLDFPLRIFTHDVIVQHLRFVIGGDISDNWDGFDIYRGPGVILDHCSMRGAFDEGVGISSAYLKRITVSNCIIANSKYASLIYTGDSVSFVRNLMINIGGRCPMPTNIANHIEIANNLLYNTATENSHIYYNSPNSVALKSDCIGNVLIRGPESLSVKIIQVKADLFAGSEFYIDDNIDINKTSEWSIVTGDTINFRSDIPLINDGYVAIPSSQVREYVLNNCGARPLDAFDQNLINSVE